VTRRIRLPIAPLLGIAMDVHFYEKLPELFPHVDAKAWFKDLPENVLEYLALRNGSLQGAYFMLAARSLGLDCGPMSGFDNDGVDKEFFAGTNIKSNFICAVGHGDPAGVFPRNPRLSFDEACKIL
jgi:3-hydroxypropanoate dehydrogenase